MNMKQTTAGDSLAHYFYGAVTVGERGQVVIPAEARKQSGLEAGEKLLVFKHPHVRGLVLARVDDMQALLAELQQWTSLVSGITGGIGSQRKAGKSR
jgi:AbrB family looped-hinge helix DNA binding protein